jgi:uncharacterized protein (DUF2141 family)
MMKKIILMSMGLVLLITCSFAQYKLDIEIIDVKNNTGNIMLQLFDRDENIIQQEMSPVKDKKCMFTFQNLKSGKYAVRYYHDENLNGKMDTSLVGKPTEGYGFSNNVTGRFGPPPFEKWLFDLNKDNKIVLKPTY